ncbi:CsbD family protein [Tuberibacillus sp. Marseille-P3662]|uniref:CsbD family protein n=1 Tax=Tuberibacillus sp. Marseille-P3662 TaxID=1965358 RepID=UPI0020CB3B2A|nr:CsbD family protein [Tuberibacillus sp. Marseille-P3662]
MSQDDLTAKGKQIKGEIKKQWGKLTNDTAKTEEGKEDQRQGRRKEQDTEENDQSLNKDRIKGMGKQIKGEAQKQWGKYTGDNDKAAKGEKDKIAGKAQEKYGEINDKSKNQ